jgi:hypothetical protein
MFVGWKTTFKNGIKIYELILKILNGMFLLGDQTLVQHFDGVD